MGRASKRKGWRARNTERVLPEEIAGRPEPLFAWQHAIAVSGSRFGPPVASPLLHDCGPLVVPRRDSCFMLGDDRDDSVDSQYYGPAPRRNVRGSPMCVYYSYEPAEGVEFVRALSEIRGRIGTWIR